jgi:Skp family chaperone for outer membrane proteins
MRHTTARLCLMSILITGIALAAHAAPGIQKEPAAEHLGGMRQPQSPPGDSGPLAELNHQIQAMRAELHAQLDPLQAQMKALHEKYDPQIKTLEERRHALAEQGKPRAVQALDEQEERDLAALSDQEKAEVDKLRQVYADKRTSVRADYAARIKG